MTELGYALTEPSVAVPVGRRSRGRRLALAAALWAVFLGNAAAITWLWLNGGGISSVHTLGDLATSLGRITGLLGAYFALVQVLLLARLPPLERLVGFDRLTVWHRRNGKLTLYLVLAHVVLITLGYAAMDRISVPKEISRLLSSYPGMITATVGTVFFVVVVVTSLVIVRRRLPYESWHAVHLLAYAAIALSWFHQIPTGNELSVDTTAADYWRALYVATLLILVVFRVLAPAWRTFSLGLRVEEVVVEGPDVVSLRIGGRRLDRLGARGGQFFMWRFLSRRGRWWEAHPFSLSAPPSGSSLRITVKGVGGYSRALRDIEPGTRVVAEGPFGVFTDDVRRSDKALLIAGGIGITPIRSLLGEMRGDVAVLYRVVRDDEIVFRDELDALARDRGVAVTYVVGDHAAPGGGRLLSPEHLRELVPDVAERDVFLCGPPAMTDAIEKSVRAAGVPRPYVHVERFAL
ncbi:MAG TPA: ferredoxin reductase family protein [Gaiellaceae bacterium]|nr:ferredoxin reductase family protein [Gaiellaceae bacterium]